jgi:hypothetical protein
VLEPTVDERRAVEPLRGRSPAELAVEPVVVVVGSVGGDRGIGRGEVGEVLAVEDLGLERRPEGLDLAVRPGRVDLGPDVPDLELGEAPLEATEHRAHHRHEGRPVVGHQLMGDAAQVDGLREGFEDRERLPARDGPDAEEEAAEVVDEGDEVAGPSPSGRRRQVEGALEVDVPELVRARPLVAGTRHAGRARPVRARARQ